MKNIRTWLCWSSSSYIIIDLVIQIPSYDEFNSLGKVLLIAQVVMNWMVFASVIYSYRKNSIVPIHMALNMATLRYQFAPWVPPGPNITENLTARSTLRDTFYAILICW